MSDVTLTEAEQAWISYRNDIQKQTPWENHRRAMRRLRKREFIAGYQTAAEQIEKDIEAVLAVQGTESIGVSCGGYSVDDSGCYVSDLAQRIRARDKR